MFQKHDISSLIALEPKKASAQILEASERSGVHKGDAAKALGCSLATLLRWIAKLGLEPKIAKAEKAAEKAGTLRGGRRKGGRHKGSLDRGPRAPRGSRSVAA